jgi:glutaredoxin
MKSAPPRRVARWPLAATALLLLSALPAQALYKVVGPDGKVTYTDRPPLAVESRVMPLNANGNVGGEVVLPTELRQAVQRFPVTLFVTDSCGPCDAGRQLLMQRGIPFTEKTVTSAADNDALLKLTGANEAPTLTIGGQVVRGLTDTLWNSYLDSAGYPRQSALPFNYQYPAVTPMVARASTVAPAVPRPLGDAVGVSPRTPAAAPPPTTGGIRF